MMQEELITDAAMQHHTLNKMIEYWVRVNAKAASAGDYSLQNSAEVVLEGLSLAAFYIGEVFDKRDYDEKKN
jgi:hypothetical protein